MVKSMVMVFPFLRFEAGEGGTDTLPERLLASHSMGEGAAVVKAVASIVVQSYYLLVYGGCDTQMRNRPLQLSPTQKQLHKSIYEEVCQRWGGEPLWSEFKNAAKNGKVSASRVRAYDTIGHPNAPRLKQFFTVIVLSAISLLAVPLSIGAAFVFDEIGLWFIPIGILVWWRLREATFSGMCSILIEVAQRDEGFYYHALRRGAFDF